MSKGKLLQIGFRAAVTKVRSIAALAQCRINWTFCLILYFAFVCVRGGGECACVCLAYTSEDFHMKTLRHTEDSTPSEDPKTGPRKTLAKNAENVMFYHLRGVRAPRTSMDFQPYLIYEDIRVLGSISKASRCVRVCDGVNLEYLCYKYVFYIAYNLGSK